jgi:hypothetical protein
MKVRNITSERKPQPPQAEKQPIVLDIVSFFVDDKRVGILRNRIPKDSRLKGLENKQVECELQEFLAVADWINCGTMPEPTIKILEAAQIFNLNELVQKTEFELLSEEEKDRLRNDDLDNWTDV